MADPLQAPEDYITGMLRPDPDAQARQEALVKVLRGQAARAPMAAVLSGSGFQGPAEIQQAQSQGATSALVQMGEKEQERRLQAAQALREIAAQKASLGYKQLGEQREEQRLSDTEQQQAFERSHQRAELGLQGEKFEHEKQEKVNAQTQILQKELEPLDAIDVVLKRVEDGVKKYGVGHLPGVGAGVAGVGTGMLPESMISDEGKQFRKDVNTLGLQGDRVISGSTGFGKSPEMTEKLQHATGLFQRGTDADIDQGTKLLRQLHDTTRANVLKGAPKEAVDTYNARSAPAPKGPAGSAPPAGVVEKGGKKYQKINGKWHEL